MSRWERLSGEKLLSVELVEVEPTTWPAGAWDQPVTAELRSLDGEVFQRYSTVEKATTILRQRGWRPADRLAVPL